MSQDTTETAGAQVVPGLLAPGTLRADVVVVGAGIIGVLMAQGDGTPPARNRNRRQGWRRSTTGQSDGTLRPAVRLGDRLLGQGRVERVVGDLERLRVEGARAVVPDPYFGDPERTRTPELAWHALAVVRKEAR